MTFLGAMIVGDIHTLIMMLEKIGKKIFGDKISPEVAEELIEKIKVIYSMVSYTNKDFHSLCEDKEKLSEYYDKIYRCILKPLLDSLKINVPKDLLTGILELLQKIIFNAFSANDAKTLSIKLMNFIKEKVKQELGKEVVKNFENLFFAISGISLSEENVVVYLSAKARTDLFIEVFIGILLPDMKPCLGKIKMVVDLSFRLYQISGDKEEIRAYLPELAEKLGNLFGINSEQLNLIMRIIEGDPSAIRELAAPICKIDSPIIDILFGILKDTKGKMGSIKSLLSSGAKKYEEQDRGSWLDILKKVKDGTADIRDLFQMLDMKNGKKGGITTKEFKDLLAKLSMTVTEHRIQEIFAKCKKRGSKAKDVLDNEGNLHNNYHFIRVFGVN